MEPVERILTYHERTKHHFHRYAPSLGYLDWSTQPDPFRRFTGAPVLPLGLEVPDPKLSYDELYLNEPPLPTDLTHASLSKFFELSLALSAWKQFGQSKWALRINPSSGNLHPTEAYVVTGPIHGLYDQPTVCHYAPREQALEARAVIAPEAWESLASPWPEGSFLVALTSIHWREAWKYGERAYRYCQHDAGHALAALSMAARLHGWNLYVMKSVADATIESLLGLDRLPDFQDAEREAPDMVALVMPAVDDASSRGAGLASAAIQPVTHGQWSGRANRLSSDHVAWDAIDDAHAAARKSPASLCPDEASGRAPEFPGPLVRKGMVSPASAARIIRQRRSAVDFDGHSWLHADEFFLMLDRVLPRWNRAPWNALGPPACIDLVLFVHRVRDLAPGLYCLARETSRIDAVRAAMRADFTWRKPAPIPEGLPLFLLESGDARKLAKQVSCHQDIASDGAFGCGMIADFEGNLRRFGAWFYRRLFWETGVIGQVLYLEAEAAGVRGTGIGCFFDDPVHDVFGFRDRRFQSLYHFTVGRPVEDLRLKTWAPYERRE